MRLPGCMRLGNDIACCIRIVMNQWFLNGPNQIISI